jgi:hypothetical protein
MIISGDKTSSNSDFMETFHWFRQILFAFFRVLISRREEQTPPDKFE